jgi:hypothetical protein
MTVFKPITDEEVKELGSRLDSLLIAADSIEDMYLKLNTLTKNGSPNWRLLCSPRWVRDNLIAIVVKPRTE